MLARGGVDTLNPQSAEIAFAGAAVAESILASFGYRLLCHPNGVFAATVIAFGFR
jgi:hypothetical protein